MNKIAENQTSKNSTEITVKSRKFNLDFGYQDKENPEVFHREVTISRRPNGADYIQALASAVGENGATTRINLLLIGAAISEFGSLPVINGRAATESILLSLNEIDNDILNEEYLMFLVSTQPVEEGKILEAGKIQLAFGIERNGIKYQIIEFGKLLDGFDRIEIDGQSDNDWQFEALKIAREVVKISTLDGATSLSGALTLADIEAMDWIDYTTVREAESQWLKSFRSKTRKTAETR